MADLKVLGEQAFAKYPKVSHELLSLTYGALVAQVVAECETVAEANSTLKQMGRKIGIRLVEEFLARSGISSKCKDFQETCNVIAKVRLLPSSSSFFLLTFLFVYSSHLRLHQRDFLYHCGRAARWHYHPFYRMIRVAHRSSSHTYRRFTHRLGSRCISA